jgi:glycosyltransferase involved in cell wall biosynthesis
MYEQLYQLILYFFYAVVIVQSFFLVIIFPKIFFIKKNKDRNSQEAVSIVIAAKDEYYNLSSFLPKIMAQDYPDFEVIVVNHGSQDDSEFVLKEMQDKHSNFKYINVQSDANFFGGKKFPLSIGIKSAKNDLLLLTDADCYPASPHWISNMVNSYSDNTEIVLGYGGYEEKRGLLNKIVRFDTLRVALMYFSFALWKMPYMGVGRNLSYRKSLFYKQQGFTKHYTTASGDDDLFVNKAANRKNTNVSIDADSKTISLPKETINEWVKQKRRHFTSGKHYKKWHLFILGLWESSTLFYFLLTITLITLNFHLQEVLYVLIIRTIVNLFLIKKLTNVLNERKLLLLSPLLELTIVLLGTLLNMSNLLYKQRKWK